MSKIALDVGEKYVGVAISDISNIIALPLKVLIRKTFKEDVKEIQNIIQIHKVDEVVYGFPVNLKGKETKSTRMVKSYVEKLSKEINLPFTQIDERLTTVEAERIIREMKVKRGRKKKIIDKIAACLILQTFLSNMKKNES